MEASNQPSPHAVQALMQMYPKLDHLMAETILCFSEDQLGEFLEKKSAVVSIDDNQTGKIES
jgi:hypothetical protein|eukprot:3825588-Prymnesium_polylepis.1